MTATKELIKNLDAEWLEDMLIYSMRYTLGRSSYSPGVSMDFIRPLIPHLTDKALFVMWRDILERFNPVYGKLPYQSEWYGFWVDLNEEKNKRQSCRV